MNAFAIAHDIPDCDHAIQVLSAAGIEASAEGSRVGGYVLFATDPNRAQSVVSQSHRFRTGDLHLLFLQHPRAAARQLHPDDIRRYHEWRLGLRTRDGMIEQQLSTNDQTPDNGPRRTHLHVTACAPNPSHPST
jgi:hypothetical protein